MYTVFVRSWWKIIKTPFGNRKEPNPGARRTIIGHAQTEEEAREICKAYNDSHNPGPTSRKAEYTSQF